ncbi:MAG: hypothetical protein M3T56_17425 [Chloroflexota bacterium]|nr:hypothetical protein [Chloroflexota bacterium]
MRDAFFFLSIAGLGVSVAGFSGLVTAFRRPDGAWTRTELWRLRAIPRFSFVLVFLALAPFPLFALTGDEALVIRIVSGLIVLVHLYDIIAPRFQMANWPGQSWLISAAAESAVALLSVVNLFAAQTGLLELALLLRLVHPVDLFIRVLGHFEPPVADA